MSMLITSIRNLLILGVFAVGFVVAAASFGLFGCTCMAEQTHQDPPSRQPHAEPIWSTSQGSK